MSGRARFTGWTLRTVLVVGALFALAGRWDLPFLWAYAVVVAALIAALIQTVDPDLLRERRSPGPGGQDRSGRLLLGALGAAHFVIGPLDTGRFHWSPPPPPWLQAFGLMLFAGAMAVLVWAMAVNRFFSPVVRIQAERGHHLVTAGPYRFVRHPGYAAMVIGLPASALALGSWWAGVPAAAFAFLVLRRILIEDPFLIANLPGYPQYAARVRFRLLPGVW